MSYHTNTHWKYLAHAGKKGMKWGYNDGKKNGKRTAGEVIKDILGYDEKERYDEAYAKLHAEKDDVNKVKSEYELLAEQGASNSALSVVNDVYEQEYAEWEEAFRDFDEAYNEYMRTPLAHLDTVKGVIEDGMKTIAKFLSKFKK